MQKVKEKAVMNTYSRFPVTITKGKGSFVWDEHGEKYLDFTSGIAVCNLGHVPDPVKTAVDEQLDQLWHCSNLYHIPQQEQLAALLTQNSCFDEVFFCNSGAEANEAAIKLARIYANKNDKSPTIVTFKQSFHGRTLATLTATGQEKIQTGFAPLMPGFKYLLYNDFSSLEQLKMIKPCAVMLELVQGEGGVHPANQAWIDELVAICKAENILIMIDEVQTGMGRTGKLFCYEHYGFEPDIMTLAKGLGSGFPIGAMLAKEHVAQYFTPGTHGSTFGGNPLAATAGLATLKQFVEENILQTSQQKMEQLKEQLLQLKETYPFIKEVRGLGFLIGIEIDGNAAQIVQLAIKEKLLILTAGQQTIRLLPPLTVSEGEIEMFVNHFKKVLQAYANQ